MLISVDNNLWFDNEKLYIISDRAKKIKYEENYDLFEQCTIKASKNFKPTIIYMSSLSCNLKCKYCYADSGTYGYKQDDSSNLFFKFDDYVETYTYFYDKYSGVRAITFFGGEPLLNFDVIKKFVIYLSENYKENEMPILSVASNGTIMNDEIKEFIQDYKISFGTSLDGPKYLNDLVRIGDDIESVYDIVDNTLFDLPLDNTVLKGLQLTLALPHIENYKKDDIILWLKELENKNLGSYEIVPAITEDSTLKIDLKDEKIIENYIQLCNDYADYSIKLLTQQKKVAMSSLAVGIMTRIIKREYQNDCSAGMSFSITPDRTVTPCHVFVNNPDFEIKFDELFEEKLKNNVFFEKTKKASRKDVGKCNECIAKNLCSYWCKGFAYDKNTKDFQKVVDTRCMLIDIFVRKIIKFLHTEYKVHKEIVNNNIRYYNGVTNVQT